MTEEINGADLSVLRKKLLGVPIEQKTATRWEEENRPVAPADRRRMRTAQRKDAQMNLKVTPAFKARVTSMAQRKRTSVVEFIERAVEAYSEKGGGE